LDLRPLDDREIDSWLKHRALNVRAAFAPADMVEVSRLVDDLLAAPEEPGRHWVYYEESLGEPESRIVQRIENFVPFHDGFQALCAAVGDNVARLLGEPAVLFKDKINLKLPGGDGFKPHQDHQAGWWRYASMFVSVLVAIDDATEENGCLEVAFGHHDRGMIGKEWAPLDDADMAGMTFRSFPCAPGDMLYFDSFVPHSSQPNRTDRPRRALYLTYNRASEGDQRARYYADKHESFPPDIEREPGLAYKFRV